MSIVPFRWRPSKEQLKEFWETAEHLTDGFSEEEAKQLLEKLTVPELVRVIDIFDLISSRPRRDFRRFRALCIERYGAGALARPDGRRRENKLP
jgi:hypothetical protein